MRRGLSLLGAAALLSLAAGSEPVRLRGLVVDAADGHPIAAATVVAGGGETLTDSTGRYALASDAARLYVRAPGYRAAELITTPESEDRVALQRIEPRALYLSAYGVGHRSVREAALKLVADAGLNALVIDVKSDAGLVPYPSAVPLAAAIGARRVTTVSDLPSLVESLHARGLYLIARIVVFKDDPLAGAHPEYAVHRDDGTLFRDKDGLAWTDPYVDAVRDYNLAIAVEAAEAGFDEIQFDYLRFPDTPHLRFAADNRQALRVAAIGDFLRAARDRLRPYNVYLAADVFGYVCWNRDDTQIGQQLEALMPLLDYLSPMLYPSGFQAGIPGYRNPVEHPYEIVRRSLESARARVPGSPLRFRPWLQAFRDYAFDRRQFDADELRAQIRAAGDAGSDGWMLWNPRNVYRDWSGDPPSGEAPPAP